MSQESIRRTLSTYGEFNYGRLDCDKELVSVRTGATNQKNLKH